MKKTRTERKDAKTQRRTKKKLKAETLAERWLWLVKVRDHETDYWVLTQENSMGMAVVKAEQFLLQMGNPSAQLFSIENNGTIDA